VTELQRLGRIRRDFVANISHELRTPVTTLQLVTETLANALRDNLAAAPDLLTKLRGQIELLNQLTEEAMDLALIESGQMPLKLVEAHLAGLLNQVLDLLRPQAEQKQIAIDAQISSDLIVLADSAGAQKVLRNLLHNAIKFTPSGGRISVRARRDADNIEIQVSDTGIGIPAKDLPRIFERFYKADRARAQGEARGTGLGLAIAKHIVEGHGGRIWAESVEGRGSTFHFTLPAAS
jgi:two-component system phosphate regulon sensor histidine kinase PhoR